MDALLCRKNLRVQPAKLGVPIAWPAEGADEESNKIFRDVPVLTGGAGGDRGNRPVALKTIFETANTVALEAQKKLDEISEQEKTNAQQSLTNLLWDGEQAVYKILNFKSVELKAYDKQVTVLLNPMAEELSKLDKAMRTLLEKKEMTLKKERKKILEKYGLTEADLTNEPKLGNKELDELDAILDKVEDAEMKAHMADDLEDADVDCCDDKCHPDDDLEFAAVEMISEMDPDKRIAAMKDLMAMRIKRREMVSKRNAEKKKARLVLREQKATAELKARRIERELLKKKFKDVQAALKALHEMETKTAKDLNDLRGGNSSEETDDPEKFEAEKANKRLRLLYTWLEKSRALGREKEKGSPYLLEIATAAESSGLFGLCKSSTVVVSLDMDKLADLWAQLVKEGMEEKKFFKMFEPQAPKKYSMFKNGSLLITDRRMILLSTPEMGAAETSKWSQKSEFVQDGVFLREVNPGATTREFPDTLAFKCCHCNPLVRASRFLWPQTYKITHVRVSQLITWEVPLITIGAEPLTFDALDTHQMSALVKPDPGAGMLGALGSFMPCFGKKRSWNMEMVDGVQNTAKRSITFPVLRMPKTNKLEPWEDCAADVTINFTSDLEKSELLAFFTFLNKRVPAAGHYVPEKWIPEPEPPEFKRPERVKFPPRGDRKLKAPSDVNKPTVLAEVIQRKGSVIPENRVFVSKESAKLAELKLKQLKKDEEKKKGDGNSMAGKFEVLLGGGKGKGAGEGSKKGEEA